MIELTQELAPPNQAVMKSDVGLRVCPVNISQNVTQMKNGVHITKKEEVIRNIGFSNFISFCRCDEELKFCPA